jgi:predicted dehydrogenase
VSIHVGILGCAAIAKRSLAPAFAAHPSFQLMAIASRTAEKAEAFAGQYGARPCSYNELVGAEDVDLIYCPLPTGLHAEWVAKCLQAGKHVLCEKSLACTYEEVSRLVKLARERHLLLMESFQFRFHAQNLYVKRLLQEKAIGPLRQVVVRFGIPPFPEGSANIRYSRELGGGALLDNGAYTLKAASYLLGDDLAVLAAMDDANRPDKDGIGDDVDLTGSIMLRTADGVPVQTAYGFSHFYQNGYEIWGKEGKITTTRAFTARPDFAAPVILETREGHQAQTFMDDHFCNMLTYLCDKILQIDFSSEYDQNLQQARLMEEVRVRTIRNY